MVDEGEVLRRDSCAAVREPSRIRSIGEKERRHIDMESITSLCMTIQFRLDRVVKKREPVVLLMNARAFVQERLELLGILHLDGEMCGTHAVVQSLVGDLRRTRARIARQLNPDAAPTFTILRRHAEDPQSPLSVDTGATCRVRLWRPVGEGEPGVLGVGRRIESEDGSRDEVLVSAIATVLDEDGELLTVRDATEAEAARVLAVERAW